MQVNKFLLLEFGILSLVLGVWLYKANERPKIVFMLSIEVNGHVNAPGIYRLSNGSRVSDAINMAGGVTETANEEWISKNINRTGILKDGQKIYIK